MRGLLLALPALCLAACSKEPPPQAQETEIPKELAGPLAAAGPVGSEVGTPLKDRVATLRDPASFAAEQWQLVDGAFTYVSGDHKLKLLRVNPGK